MLDAKAIKLAGAAIDPRQDESPYARLLLVDRRVDVLVTYCANAQEAIARHPALRHRRFADDVNVAAEFGIGVARDAVAAAPAFLQFACGRDGRRILASFGFDVD